MPSEPPTPDSLDRDPLASTSPDAPPAPGPCPNAFDGGSGDSPAPTTDCPALDRLPPPDPRLLRAGRYALEGEISRGGMGVVLRARDGDLDRPLAVKALAERYRGDARLTRRFRAEARITGQLQHPGIPPVHEVGVLPDGRPFFAMKLIQGRTLAQLLRERPSPAHELPAFVGAFEQVCQAVAYAHSRGVIHRDLKPENVMVGAFGEVQVMDWGLAKTLASRGLTTPGEDSAPAEADAPGSPVTQAGEVMGTPAYMAPEQARGEVDRLDERCDVFGLGALLCVLLTGQPPYRGTAAHVQSGAERGELADAGERLAACGADAGLVRLAWACLAPQPEDRPRDAGVVAQAVGAYLAGVQERLREAERQRAVAEARVVEERKRRRLAVALAGAVLLLALLGGGGAWLWQQQRAATSARRELAGQKALALLEPARRKLEQGWRDHDLARLKEARAEADQAAEIAVGGEAPWAVRHEAGALRKEAAERLDRAEKTRRFLDALLNVSYPRETRTYISNANGQMTELGEPSADEQYARAFRGWGLDVDRTSEAGIVARLRAEPEPVLQEILAALDSWALARRREHPDPRAASSWRRLLRVAGELDRSPERRQLRALLVGEEPPRAESVAGLLGAWPPWPALAELARGRTWRHLQKLRARVDPKREPVLTLALLARVCREHGDEAGAVELLRRAVNVRRGEVILLHDLGWLLERRRPPQLEEAIGYYRAACEVRPHLGVALGKALSRAERPADAEPVLRDQAVRQPDNPELHVYLGNALLYQKKLTAAEAAYRKALGLKADLPIAHNNLGNALRAQGKHAASAAAYAEACRLKPDFAIAHYNLGLAQVDLGKPAEGEVSIRKALLLKPNDPEAYNNLGVALRAQGKLADAEGAYREAIRLKPDFSLAYHNLGVALAGQQKLAAAEAAYRESLRLEPDEPATLVNLGGVLWAQGKWTAAEAAFREVLRLQPDSPQGHYNLGNALEKQGKLVAAEAAYREALRLKHDFPEAHHSRGNALVRLGRPAEAEAACREALHLKPRYAEAHTSLGAALAAQNKLADAEAAHREALRLNPDLAEAHNNLGIVLARQRKPAAAEAALRETVRLKPDDPEARNNLGVALRAQGKLAAAEAVFREAVRLKPDLADAHYNLGLTLAAQGKLGEAEAAYRQVVRLNPGDPEGHNRLAKTLWAQGKRDEAAVAFREVLRLKPDDPEVLCNLGLILADQMKLSEALASLRKGHELGARRPGWLSARSAALIRRVERLLEFDQDLPAFLSGKRQPSGPAEQVELADLCVHPARRRYAASARFYADAFAAKPALADDLAAGHRSRAACAAALAGCGRGVDAGKLTAEERARLRRQALDWLRADLAARTNQIETGNPQGRGAALRKLSTWRQGPDLASVRDAGELKRLPDEERAAWLRLWADVEAALKRVGGK